MSDHLTLREMEMLYLLSQGLTDQEMAKKAAIDKRTVQVHLDNIREKTNLNTRTNLVTFFVLRIYTRNKYRENLRIFREKYGTLLKGK